MEPNLVKLTEQDKTILAELYIEEMETRFLQEKPYFNSIELGSDIIKRQKCSVREGMDVMHILVRAHTQSTAC